MPALSSDAIRFYANEPIYFVEDIIKAIPDEKQRDILRSLRDYPMTSVRSGHGVGNERRGSLVSAVVHLHPPVSEDPRARRLRSISSWMSCGRRSANG